MAHWARIDEDNIVIEVIVTENSDDEGQGWVSENLQGTWLKTSYNTRLGKHLFDGEPFRKNFAQPGYSYDSNLDAFIPPKMPGRKSFILDTKTATWMPPIPFPEDATWIPEFQDMPEGHDDFEEKRVYFWMNGYQTWGLIPCDCMPPPEMTPDKIYFWHPIEKEWQLPDFKGTEENHHWNPIEKKWQSEDPMLEWMAFN
jgi:hypothetical protein